MSDVLGVKLDEGMERRLSTDPAIHPETVAPAQSGLALAAPSVMVHRAPDGSLHLRSTQRLQPYARCVGDWLDHWAAVDPERHFLCERDGAGAWATLSYGQARQRALSVAQHLLDRGLDQQTPLAALSGNGMSMAVVMLAALYAGVPFAPISPSYALLSTDHAKLRETLDILAPKLVYVSDIGRFGHALRNAGGGHIDLLVGHGPTQGWRATTLDDCLSTAPGATLASTFASLRPDTVAKILFTSGSTGAPKGVLNTHRMMCSNQQALTQLMPFLADEPPVMVDWLPWHHTAGSNGSFNMVLRHGGTLYIDEGKPTPADFHRTVRNLSDVESTLHTNVPRGYEMLLHALEQDAGLQSRYFKRLKYMCFAGAAMPRQHFERLSDMARRHRGSEILFTAGYGATETGPAVTVVHFANRDPANIGLPLPGTEVKLRRHEDKLEVLVRGPNITPGYWRSPELSRAAFDDEGFYRLGDAARFLDEARPEAGLLFDGRVAEDFKLRTATWVNVAGIRARALVHGAPLFQDVVVTGHGEDDVGLLVVLNDMAARARFGIDASATSSDVAAHPLVKRFMAEALARMAAESTGSSNRPVRALVLDPPPTLDTGEMTDKGSVSQRVVLQHRAAVVARLHGPATSETVTMPRA